MFEVLIPVRNPGQVFRKTIDSLLAQTRRDFSVLISDNYSTTGKELINEAILRLGEAKIPARILRPPWELGRVHHWNWIHHQSEAAWLKPLFVGDWLEPDCVAACVQALTENPETAFLFFHFRFHRGEDTFVCDCQGQSGRLDPNVVPGLALFEGNFVGGPVNVLYRRAAFEAAGGHLPSLPLMADFDLYTRLAMEVPTYVLPRVLGHFTLHENRFSKKGSGLRRESMNAEWVIEAALIQYGAHGAGRSITAGRFMGRIARLLGFWAKEQILVRLGRLRRSFTRTG